jgi:hypothetical protein
VEKREFACAERVTLIVSAHHVGCNTGAFLLITCVATKRVFFFLQEARVIGSRDGNEALSHDAALLTMSARAFDDGGANSTQGTGDDRDLGLVRFHGGLLVCSRRLSEMTHLGGRLIAISLIQKVNHAPGGSPGGPYLRADRGKLAVPGHKHGGRLFVIKLFEPRKNGWIHQPSTSHLPKIRRLLR